MMHDPIAPVGEPGATNAITSNPARLSPELSALFPARVVAVELTTGAPQTVLTESELNFISHCAQKRINDFTRGRACAHRALSELGVQAVSVPAGAKREPLWPAGIVGSITHTAGFAAAVVARRCEIEALGLDCEVVDSVGPDVWEQICTPDERDQLSRLPEAQTQRLAALIFAAKEAFYKCQFPLSGEWVGFEEVNIKTSESGLFRIIPVTRLPVPAPWVGSLTGRYAFRGPWVVAGITASNSAQL